MNSLLLRFCECKDANTDQVRDLVFEVLTCNARRVLVLRAPILIKETLAVLSENLGHKVFRVLDSTSERVQLRQTIETITDLLGKQFVNTYVLPMGSVNKLVFIPGKPAVL